VETLREIRRRIRSVRNLGQVTHALEAVSASRVQKAQAATLATRAYTRRAWEMITNIANLHTEAVHPLLTHREPVRSVLIAVFASDRGLCGAYNHNVIQAAVDYARSLPVPVRYIAVGRRSRDALWRMHADIVADFDGLPTTPRMLDVTPIAGAAIEEFLAGRADEVLLAYSDFVSLARQQPVIHRLLPLRPSDLDRQAAGKYVVALQPVPISDTIYEPDQQGVLDVILPRFTELQVYQASLEASASEHAARRMAMHNAAENAADLLRDLTLDRNKVRQKAITSELLDIAGGAEALRQYKA
jgi:F-type H+-transporting ATPase subunit gamma